MFTVSNGVWEIQTTVKSLPKITDERVSSGRAKFQR